MIISCVYTYIYIYTLYVLSGNIIPKTTHRNYIYTVRDSSDVQEWKNCSKTVQKKIEKRSKSTRKRSIAFWSGKKAQEYK
jgi:hypothetical protein